MLQAFTRLFGKWNAGLATLLAVAFGALALVLTGGMAIVADSVATPQIQREIGNQLAGFAVEMRYKLDQGMFERWRDIQVAASLDTIRNPSANLDAKRAVLKRLQATYPDYAIVGLASPRGVVLAASNRLIEGTDISTRKCFLKGRVAPYVGDLQNAKLLAKRLPQSGRAPPRFLVVAAPVLGRHGLPGGVIFAHLNWEWARKLRRTLFNRNHHSGAEGVIVSKNGTVLLGPAALRGKRLDLNSIKEAQAGHTGSIREIWPDGRSYLTGYSRTQGYQDYPGLGWIVLVREDLNIALAPARQIRGRIIAASLIAGLLAVLFSIVLARLITSPLRKLTAAARCAQRSPAANIPPADGYAEVTSLSLSLAELLHQRQRREDELIKAQAEARRAETEARSQEASFRLLFRANPVPMYVYSRADLRFLAVNNAAEKFYGFTSNEFSSMTLFDIRPPSEYSRLREAVSRLETIYQADHPWRHRKKDGTEVLVVTYGRTLEYEGLPAVLVAVIDVTERLRTEGELRDTRKFLDTIVESMPAMLLVKEARKRRFVLVNKAGEELLGINRQEMLGKNDYDLFPKEQADFFAEKDLEVLRAGELQVIEQPVETRNNGGRLLRTKKIAIKDDAGDPQYVLTLSEDITERRAAEVRIAHMAHHDALTGLPNRVLLRECLEEGLTRVQTHPGHQISVIYLDLDNFKDVNDTFGHSFGDALLVEVAKRLRNCLREDDVVARLGGDEFAVIHALGPTEADEPIKAMNALASRILASVIDPFDIEGHRVAIGTSIGVAIAPGDGIGSDQLLKNADMAMYRAKGEGRGTFCFFEPAMDARVRARRALEADLREALMTGEIEVFYQPLVEISTRAINGVEALARWRHPRRGMIFPAEFISVAEETGLIVQLGEQVLRQACAEVASWPGAVRVAVNLSPVQFKRGNLLESVTAAIAFSGLSPDRLEVEITETTLLQDDATTLATLMALRGMGIRVSMDDFGTGYSSLSYLRKYPFDKIKIDQSFVRELSHAAESHAIVQAIIGLGAALGMVVTAEGVETEEQLALLQAAGCNEAQGYLFGRPRPAIEIRRLLSREAAA